jgi:hypothetical protein
MLARTKTHKLEPLLPQIAVGGRQRGKLLTFASNLDLAASVAFPALSAAVAGRAGYSAPRPIKRFGKVVSGEHSYAVANGAASVARRIAIEAHVR